jgi:hypothetical protein
LNSTNKALYSIVIASKYLVTMQQNRSNLQEVEAFHSPALKARICPTISSWDVLVLCIIAFAVQDDFGQVVACHSFFNVFQSGREELLVEVFHIVDNDIHLGLVINCFNLICCHHK